MDDALCRAVYGRADYPLRSGDREPKAACILVQLCLERATRCSKAKKKRARFRARPD